MTVEKHVLPEMHRLEFEVQIHKDQCANAVDWCNDQFGSRWSSISNRSGRWALFWCGNAHHEWYKFCFAQEQDMTWFSLRWL